MNQYGQFKMIDKRVLRALGIRKSLTYLIYCESLGLISNKEKEQWIRWIFRSF